MHKQFFELTTKAQYNYIMANPTKESVLESIQEYDEIGLDAFAEKYGTGKRSYYEILYNGKTYQARAISVSYTHLRAPRRS